MWQTNDETYPNPKEWVLWWEEAFMRLERDWQTTYDEDIPEDTLAEFAGTPFIFLRYATSDEVIEYYPDDLCPLMPVEEVAVISTYCDECEDVEEWLWLWPDLFMEGKRRCCGKPFVFNPLMFGHYQDAVASEQFTPHIKQLFTIHMKLTDSKDEKAREWAGYGAR